MNVSHKNIFRWGFRLLLTGVLLFFLFTRVDFSGFTQTLHQIRPAYYLVAMVLVFLYHLAAAYQMELGLAPLGLTFSVWEVLRIMLIAGFYSLVVPGGMVAGGVASWYKLSKRQGKPVEAGALVFYFRLVNTLVLVGLGMVGMWFDEQWATPQFRIGVAALFAGLLLMLVPFASLRCGQTFQAAADRWLSHHRIPGAMRRLVGLLLGALKAFQELPARTLGRVWLLAFFHNGLIIVIWYMLALAAGVHLPLLVAAWITALQTVLLFLPTYGGLGVREISLVYLLALYGVGESEALLYSLVVFSMMMVWGLLGGLLELTGMFRRPAGHERNA